MIPENSRVLIPVTENCQSLAALNFGFQFLGRGHFNIHLDLTRAMDHTQQ
jgi:hypothetical protein